MNTVGVVIQANTTGFPQAKKEVDDLNRSLSAHASAATDAAQAAALQEAKIVNATQRSAAAIERAFGTMKNVTASSTREMGIWGAMQAEAAGHMGEHSFAIGRLERALGSYAGEAAGANRITELLGTSLLKFGIGSVETIGVLAGIAAIAVIYDKLTESARKVQESADKASESIEKMLHLKALGVGADLKDKIADLNKQIAADNEAIARGQAGLSASGGASLQTGSALSLTPKQREEAEADLQRHVRNVAAANAEIRRLETEHSLSQAKMLVGRVAELIKNGDATAEVRAKAIAQLKEYHENIKFLQRVDPAGERLAATSAAAKILEDALYPKKKEQGGDKDAERKFRELMALGRQASEEAFRSVEQYNHAQQERAKQDEEMLASGERMKIILSDKLMLERLNLSEADKQNITAQKTFDTQRAEIEKLFEKRDSEGHLVQLNDAEIAQRKELLRLNEADLAATRAKIAAEQAAAQAEWRDKVENASRSGNRNFENFEREKDRIYAEARKLREEAAKAGISPDEAVPKIAAKSNADLATAKMKLLQSVVNDTSAAFDRLASTMERSHSRGARAAQSAAGVLHKVHAAVIGFEAALEAKKEGAKALASFAVQDYVGGALHLASAAEFVATAIEAGVSAGSGGGGGGGGGGSNSGVALGTQGGNNDQTIKIEVISVTKDLNGREISRVSQGIQRANDLNQPIRLSV